MLIRLQLLKHKKSMKNKIKCLIIFALLILNNSIDLPANIKIDSVIVESKDILVKHYHYLLDSTNGKNYNPKRMYILCSWETTGDLIVLDKSKNDTLFRKETQVFTEIIITKNEKLLVCFTSSSNGFNSNIIAFTMQGGVSLQKHFNIIEVKLNQSQFDTLKLKHPEFVNYLHSLQRIDYQDNYWYLDVENIRKIEKDSLELYNFLRPKMVPNHLTLVTGSSKDLMFFDKEKPLSKVKYRKGKLYYLEFNPYTPLSFKKGNKYRLYATKKLPLRVD